MGLNWLPIAGKLVDKVFGNKEDKVKLEFNRAELEHKVAMALEENQQELSVTGLNLIKAEIQSDDKYVRRARPTLFWMMYVIFGFNFLLMPLAKLAIAFLIAWNAKDMGFLSSVDLQPLSVDPALLDMFKWAFLGYGTLRTFEKTVSATDAKANPGQSSVRDRLNHLRSALSGKE